MNFCSGNLPSWHTQETSNFPNKWCALGGFGRNKELCSPEYFSQWLLMAVKDTVLDCHSGKGFLGSRISCFLQFLLGLGECFRMINGSIIYRSSTRQKKGEEGRERERERTFQTPLPKVKESLGSLIFQKCLIWHTRERWKFLLEHSSSPGEKRLN